MTALLRRYELAVDDARAEEQRMIADCVRDHSSMPPNYWHERWRAEERLKAARAMVEVLTDE
jgi:hypothetical protein